MPLLRPEAKTAPSAAFAEPTIKEKVKKKAKEAAQRKRDPRVDSIVEDVMRRSAAGFGKGLNSKQDGDDNDVADQTDS